MPETLSVLGLSADRPESELQFLRENQFGSAFYQAGSSSHRGRYLMVALLLALVVVGTIQWPFLRAHLQTALGGTAPAPAVEVSAPPRETAAPKRAESIAPPSTAEVPAQPPAAPAEAQPAPPRVGAESSAAIRDSRERVADPPVPGRRPSRASVVTLASDASASRSAVDGSQELLLAERYLQGKGTTPDPAAAARWLWKAVGKENPRAALLLADLYAHGDGVSKSCDQARILLVVAAGKGVSEAGGRLRNLESNGCR
jgi:TPR repeat protein